ncbi:hypothetical protein KC19_1G338500 [Ceratodon purpureus]|uniref:Uncharacterized protein n=1 Tax=Ceratodon purpureus TaxID=3225 RepID=A0A8T0JDM4_CERPU|nr:hypothetical protein KC19_1G338500 [Ceratodon purpureus]
MQIVCNWVGAGFTLLPVEVGGNLFWLLWGYWVGYGVFMELRNSAVEVWIWALCTDQPPVLSALLCPALPCLALPAEGAAGVRCLPLDCLLASFLLPLLCAIVALHGLMPRVLA